jgi:hypothetical protein
VEIRSMSNRRVDASASGPRGDVPRLLAEDAISST